MITDAEFTELKGAQKGEIEVLEGLLSKNGNSDKTNPNRAQRAFTLALGIEETFKNGTSEEKKELLSEIGSNLTLKEKKLNVINTGIYATIINGLLTIKTENPRFEPENIQDTSSQNEDFLLSRPTLLRR